MTSIACPTCKKEVEWSAASPYRPFCSHRCQLIDLGAWASEEYKVPENKTQDSWSETSETVEIPRNH